MFVIDSNQTGEPNTTGELPRSRRVVLGARLALLLLALAAVAAAVVVTHGRTGGADESEARYICPMHPDVTSSEPGVCPICRMELERVGTGAAAINSSTFQAYDFVRKRGFGQDLRMPAWVEGDGAIAALVYNDVLASLAPEERAVFSPSDSPATTLAVHPTQEAAAAWDTATSRVRFRLDASAASAVAPPAGQVGWVRLGAKRREVEVVPYSAVLEGDDGPYVLVASGDGRVLSRRPVELGRVLGGMAIVVGGLRAHERVMIRSAFFVDAERRLRREAAVELAP